MDTEDDNEYQLDDETLALLDSAEIPQEDLTAFSKRMEAVRDHRWSAYWDAWAEESKQRLTRLETMQTPTEVLQHERLMLAGRATNAARVVRNLWPSFWSDLPGDYRMRSDCQCVACRFVRRS